jgi:glycine cleavage system pyridoxal-binding protein P
MTNEEVERAIDFLLKSQATSEARIEQTNEQLTQLAEQLGSFADTQTEMMRIMTRTLESQDYINESLRASIGDSAARTEESISRLAVKTEESATRLAARTEESIAELVARQSKTEEALVRLADAQAQSDRRLDALIKIVGEERGGH